MSAHKRILTPIEEMKKKLKCEIYRDNMQNYKKYAIPTAQLIIADVPYNVNIDNSGKAGQVDVIGSNKAIKIVEGGGVSGDN